MRLRVLLASAVVSAAATLVACGSGDGPAKRADTAAHPPQPVVGPARASASRPNIVFVLTDDLSTDLLRFMPNVRKLARDGTSFSRYFVASSNCCPSRASIFTGMLPHNTGVLTNVQPNGGNFAFRLKGNHRRTYAVALRK